MNSSVSQAYCIHKNFSDLTIIAIIATSDLTIIAIIATSDLTIIAIFLLVLYVIYKLEGNR